MALDEQRRAKTQLDSAYETFNARLAEVKAENARRAAKWHKKRCASCGSETYYHEDWSRVPDLCKPCRERERAAWREKSFTRCGAPVRYRTDWSHPPNYCKASKTEFANKARAN